MVLPKRHRRSIVHESQEYHWYFPQGRYWDHRNDYQLIIQSASGIGRVLKVFQNTWPDVTPAFVAAAIAEAFIEGWNPEEPGAPFKLVRPRVEV